MHGKIKGPAKAVHQVKAMVKGSCYCEWSCKFKVGVHVKAEVRVHVNVLVNWQVRVNVNVNRHAQVKVILKVNGKDKGHAKAVHQAKANVKSVMLL